MFPREVALHLVRRPLVLSNSWSMGDSWEAGGFHQLATALCEGLSDSIVPNTAESSRGGAQRSRLLRSTRLFARPTEEPRARDSELAAPSPELHLQLQARHAGHRKPQPSTTRISQILPRGQSDNSALRFYHFRNRPGGPCMFAASHQKMTRD